MFSGYGGSAPIRPVTKVGATPGCRMKERIAQLLRGTQAVPLRIARHPRSLSTARLARPFVAPGSNALEAAELPASLSVGRVVRALGGAGAEPPQMEKNSPSPLGEGVREWGSP
jgi:hypothetical protein